MKRAKYFINVLLGFLLLFSFSCTKEKVKTPVIHSFELVTSPVIVGVNATFKFSFDADVGAIWSGDSTSNYEVYLQEIANPDTLHKYMKKDKGLGVSSIDSISTFKYVKAGTFKAYLVATNVGNLGEDIERATASVEVVVSPAK